MADGWSTRYLELLGVPAGPPSREHLDAIVRAHRAITFECVSSLIRRHAAGSGPVPPLDLERQLDAWTARAGGGVCFEFGAMLGPLLVDLGYRAWPVLARISFPGSHSALMAELDGRTHLVDVGNGQPILEAIPIDEPFEIDRAGLRYRFRRDPDDGRLIQDRFVEGAFRPFVTYELEAATPAELEASYQRHHALPPESFVIGSFRLVAIGEDEVTQLRDRELTTWRRGGKTVESVRDVAHYRELVAGPLGLPGMDVERGLRAWAAINPGADAPTA